MDRSRTATSFAAAAIGLLGGGLAAHAQMMVVAREDAPAGDRVMLFDSFDGSLIDANWITDDGAVGWSFNGPTEAASIGLAGEVWVSDQGGDAVHRFDANGSFLGDITTGAGGQPLNNVRSIGYDGETVLVVQASAPIGDAVLKYNADGIEAGHFPIFSGFDAEWFTGDILVANGNYLERWSPAGTFLGNFVDSAGSSFAQITVLEDDSVIAVNRGTTSSKVYHFNSDGSVRALIDVEAVLGSRANGASLLDNGSYLVAGTIFGVAVVTPDGSGGFTANVVEPLGNGQFVTRMAPPVDGDLRMLISESSDPVSVSGQLTYTVTLRNAGETTLNNVSATMTLSNLTSFVSSTAGSHDSSATGGVHTFTTPSLAPLTNESYDIVVNSTGIGTATASYAATANETDPDPANNAGSVETVFDNLVDLVVTVNDTPDPVNLLGDPITYDVVVGSNGPDPATSVVLTVDLPPESTFVSTSAGTHDGSAMGGAVTATFPSITTGGSDSVSIVVTSGVNGDYTATASATSDGADPTPSDATATATTTVDVSADIGVALAQALDAVVGVGNANTYTLTVTNGGPTAATDVDWNVSLPTEVSYVASSAGGHDGSTTGGVVSGTISALAVGASEFVTVDVSASALTDLTFVGADASPGFPVDTSNSNDSTDLATRVVADTSGFATVILSDNDGFPGLPTTAAPNTPGFTIDFILAPRVSPDGSQWAGYFNLEAELEPDREAVIVWDGAQYHTVYEESVTLMPDLFDTVERVNAFDTNDGGTVAIAARTDGAFNFDEVVATVDLAGTVAVLAREGGAAPGPNSVLYDGRMDSVQIDNAGNVYFSTPTDDASDFDEYIVQSDGTTATLLFQEGVTVPLNQHGGGMSAWDNFDNDDFRVSGDGMHVLLQGDLEGDTSFDDVLVYNDAVVVQQGVPPHPSFTSPAGSSPVHALFLSEAGDWYAVGDNDDGTRWVIRNGEPLAQSSDAVYSGAGESWSFFGFVTADGSGNYVISGGSDFEDFSFSFDEMLVLNSQTLIAREGDPIDVDGNGLFDDDTRISSFEQAGMTADDKLLVTVNTTGGTGSGQALVSYNLDLGGPACACETDGDPGQVDVFDLLAYLDLWFVSDAAADINGTTGVDVFDLLFFLDCWFPASAGSPCP